MELYLVHEEFWKCVEPATTAASGQAAVINVKKDQKARAKICLLIQSQCIPHVRTAKTAEEAWDSLKKTYEDKGLCRHLHLLMKLCSVKLNKIEIMQEYV
jgi:hypothetical protein